MRSSLVKHLHPVLGRRMVDWVVEAARPLGADPLVVVASPSTADAFTGLEVAVQREPLGTGDAVRSAREAVGDADEVLVLSGDTPLLSTELLTGLLDAHRAARRRCDRPLVRPGRHAELRPCPPRRRRGSRRDRRGRRRHARSSSRRARPTPRSTSSRRRRSGPRSWRLTPANAQGELYLTDAVRGIVESGKRVAVHVAPDPDETEGVNTRAELAIAGEALRERINRAHMLAGVTIVDPRSTWIEPTVTLEPDSVVHPFTVLRGATTVATGAEVGPHAVAIDADDRTRCPRRAVLLPSPRHRARVLGEGRHVRGAQEHRRR